MGCNWRPLISIPRMGLSSRLGQPPWNLMFHFILAMISPFWSPWKFAAVVPAFQPLERPWHLPTFKPDFQPSIHSVGLCILPINFLCLKLPIICRPSNQRTFTNHRGKPKAKASQFPYQLVLCSLANKWIEKTFRYAYLTRKCKQLTYVQMNAKCHFKYLEGK